MSSSFITECFLYTDIRISDAMFVGERSYMAFLPPHNVRYTLDVVMTLKPLGANSGLLLYMAEHLSERTSDFISLYLHQGQLHLTYNTGSDEPSDIHSDVHLVPGEKDDTLLYHFLT